MLLFLSSSPAFLLFSSQSQRWRVAYAGRRLGDAGVAVCSAHSNACIINPSRPPRLGRRSSSYVDDDEGAEEESEDEEYEIIDDDVPEFDEFGGNQYSSKTKLNSNSGARNGSAGIKMSPQKGWEAGLTKAQQSRNLVLGTIKTKPGKSVLQKANLQGYGHLKDRLAKKSSVEWDAESQQNCRKFTESSFQKLIKELDFDERWFPLVDYLSTFGLKESHFISIYERHMPTLQINLVSAKERFS